MPAPTIKIEKKIEVRAQREVRQQAALFNAVFDVAQTGLIIVEISSHQIMDINKMAAEILGSEIDDLLGQPIHQCMPAKVQEECPFHGSSLAYSSGILTLKKSDGSSVPVMYSTTGLGQDYSNLLVFSFTDITERNRAEEELRKSNDDLARAHHELKSHKNRIVQSEKLASIGQLAAGVAHEINNPVGYATSNLGTISEYIDSMKTLIGLYQELKNQATDDPNKHSTLLNQIAEIEEDEDIEFILEDCDSVMKESMEGVHRVAEIVQNLKSFAREESDIRSPHNINEGIETIIKMVWNELKYNCDIEREFGEIPLIKCHKGQINQVIMNILVNASHAMPDKGGIITITTFVKNDQVAVCIADNGKGIPPEILPKIFDPFFTTKDVGKGTGLGLSISHGIILDHGGTIDVISKVGKGTRFCFYLPITPCSEDEELIG